MKKRPIQDDSQSSGYNRGSDGNGSRRDRRIDSDYYHDRYDSRDSRRMRRDSRERYQSRDARGGTYNDVKNENVKLKTVQSALELEIAQLKVKLSDQTKRKIVSLTITFSDDSSDRINPFSTSRMLTMSNLPGCWISRNSLQAEPINLYTRQCYLDLYEMAIKDSSLVSVFTGNPGIGKSWFLMYFAMRLMYESCEAQSPQLVSHQFFDHVAMFLVCNNLDYSILQRDGAYEHKITMFIEEWEEPIYKIENLKLSYCLCDLVAEIPPNLSAGRVFVFCSPNPARYKEVVKKGSRYYMPVWTQVELENILDSTSDWYEIFEKYGGIPRLLQMQSDEVETLHESALSVKAEVIGTTFLIRGKFENKDADMSYFLVHVNPKTNKSDGSYDYKNFVFRFASQYVLDKIISIHQSSATQEHKLKFNSGKYLHTDGDLFEQLCLNALISNEFNQITVKQLDGADEITFTLPASNDWIHCKSSRHSDLRSTTTLLPNVFYRPTHRVMESGDAFCLLPTRQEESGEVTYHLIVFQITIGASHPVKGNGLKIIENAFKRSIPNLQISSSYLVFVVPVKSALSCAQTLTTQDGDSSAYNQFLLKMSFGLPMCQEAQIND